MTNNLQDLLEAAKKFVLTPEEKEQQRRSFAYGNAAIENPRITRETPPHHAKTGRAGDPGRPRAGRAGPANTELLGLTASRKSKSQTVPGGKLGRPSTTLL
jgi:hypothetical protein